MVYLFVNVGISCYGMDLQEQIANCRELRKNLGILKGRPNELVTRQITEKKILTTDGANNTELTARRVPLCMNCAVEDSMLLTKGRLEGFDTISE